MNSTVTCPACGQQLALAPKMLGKRVQCPRCQAQFVTKTVAPPPVPAAPAPVMPVPNRNQANVHKLSRSLDPADAFGLKDDSGRGKFKRDFTRTITEEAEDFEAKRRRNDRPAWLWLLPAIPLLLLIPLALYLCGVFDSGDIRPVAPAPAPVIAQAPPVQREVAPPVQKQEVVQTPPVLPKDPDPVPPPPAAEEKGPAPATQFAGLLGYWPLNLKKGSRELADESGHGHPLRLLQGGLLAVKGVRGGAVRLRVKTGLDYGDAADFNFPANAGFTFACWLKTTAKSGTVFSQRHSQDDGAVINLTVEAGRAVATMRQSGFPGFPAAVRSAGPVNDGRWHHCALLRRNNVVELYVDGASAGSASLPGLNGPIVTDWRSVGAERKWLSQNKAAFLGVSAYYAGEIDEFCIFGRELTPAEIRQLARR